MTRPLPTAQHLSYDHLSSCSCLASLKEEIAAIASRERKTPEEIVIELIELGLVYLYEARQQAA
jgi:hypothetical protein